MKQIVLKTTATTLSSVEMKSVIGGADEHVSCDCELSLSNGSSTKPDSLASGNLENGSACHSACARACSEYNTDNVTCTHIKSWNYNQGGSD